MSESELDLSIGVRSPFTREPVALALVDLPERQREAISTVMRSRCLALVLDQEEHQALARGEALRPVVRHALVRRVRALADARNIETERMVTLLLTLLDQLGQTVPFEAQSLFYTIWQTTGAGDRGMAELARRMGFVTP